MSETYFLTGALGCIGAWVTKTIVERGDVPVVFDLSDDPADRRRLSDVIAPDDLARVRFVRGDVTDATAVHRAVESSGAKRLIHLAGLQVPFCKADPALGARVNVLGTIHVFEAAKAVGAERVVYASSAAVYGFEEDAPAPDESAALAPATHYGVFKRANEGTADIYFRDDGLSSAGLRPLTVFGVGRDQGMTSGPTSAMKAAVLGRPFEIAFRGPTDFHYVRDTAEAFVACADRAPEGARIYNLHGETATVEHVVELIAEALPETRGSITATGTPIPIAPELDGGSIHREVGGLRTTTLVDGVHETLERFRALAEDGRLDTRDLDRTGG